MLRLVRLFTFRGAFSAMCSMVNSAFGAAIAPGGIHFNEGGI